MYPEERKTVDAVLRAALRSHVSDLRLRMVDQFRKEGYEALSAGRDLRPDTPSVVVFDDPNYAVIYLFADKSMNDAEYEVFRKEAQEFAWKHDAAAYFVTLEEGRITRGSG
ncbi:MAG: hypothetical protein IJ720_06635 [Clostridia bacterium]|nr:hypothetical protein [Clostridia bacterium]MBR1705022.1 hypothetical protein [Clostridia bacterium]